jgi:molecular chaperone DnaK (HSP70)
MEIKMKNSRYIVGIDLGTTNSVVSYIDTEEEISGVPSCHVFKIPQTTDAGIVENLNQLPSFLYIPGESELPKGSLALPWAEGMHFTVGTFARKRGAEIPLRLVSSAKSWLCYPPVDKTAPILPWHAPEGVPKMSPLDVSSLYLEHMRMAWNHTVANGNPDYFLQNQDVFVTVPASFDAEARDLSVKAAEKAGLNTITLLEEPQAAFYSWINKSDEEWRNQVKVGDIVLVCDIGGGTTDLSIIEVVDEAGELALKRVAVGEHILLGGDNMDLTLAYSVHRHFAEKKVKLDTKQMLGLIHSCREAKEKMMSEPDVSRLPIVILGRGRSVVGGSLDTELQREEIHKIIIEGFFPESTIEDSPVEKRVSGFRELGLQYATDTAITKYLGKFLRQHAAKISSGAAEKTQFIHPTKILFNGGVTKASVITDRLVTVLNKWLSSDNSSSVEVLKGSDPDMAVSTGAAYYGFAKRGKGIRIRAGAGRSYYIGVETSMPAVPGMPPPIKAICVVPFGMEEGTDFKIPGQEFGLVVGELAVFRFFSSLVRKDDPPGSVIEEWEEGEITELASLETVLSSENVEEGTLVPVRLHSYLTEIGVLELWGEAMDGMDRWKLEFHVREEHVA